jgi:hypothetical protein
LKILSQIGNCTVIDHHIYSNNFWKDFEDINVIHDITKSATLMCNKYLNNTGINQQLDNLSKIIDIYDLWKSENNFFELAQDLNEYFWDYSLEEFVKKIIQNNYKLPKDFINVTTAKRKKIQEDIIDLEKRKLIHRFGKSTVIFDSACFNRILIDDMKKGQNFIIGISSFGIVKIRINKNANFPEEQLNKLRFELTQKEKYGHSLAFTYKIENVNFDKIMNEAKKIIQNISEIF